MTTTRTGRPADHTGRDRMTAPRAHDRRLPALLSALLALLLLAPVTGWASGEADGPAADDLTWSVRPADNDHGTDRANYGYVLDPGAEVNDAFVVTNASAQELTLAVYAADGYTTPSGHLDLQPAGEPATDLGSWVVPETDRVVLAPGDSEEVEFSLVVPDDAAPGDHPGGIVTSHVTGDETGTVRLDRRLGSRIHVRVSGEQQVALAVSDLTVAQPFGANPVEPVATTVRYTLTNTGNVRALGHETVTVSGPGGLSARAAEVVVDELMPGSSVTREVVVDGTWPLVRVGADVRVVPEAVAGQLAEPVAVSAATWAVPWVLLGALLLLIGLSVWVGVRRVGRSPVPQPAPKSGGGTDSTKAATGV